MSRRKFALAILAGVSVVPLSGCIFLPGLVAGSGETEIIESEEVTESETPEDSDFPDVDLSPDPSDPGPTEEETEDPNGTDEVVTEWPDEVPLPPGDPYNYGDTPDFYVVQVSWDEFEDYVDDVRDVSDDEYDTEGLDDMGWFVVGEYDVFILFLGEEGDSDADMVVEIEYL